MQRRPRPNLDRKGAAYGPLASRHPAYAAYAKGNWSDLGWIGERDYAGAGIHGWPSVSMTRASKNVTSCFAAVDR